MEILVIITVGVVLIGAVLYLRANRVSGNPSLGIVAIAIAIVAFIVAAQYIQSNDSKFSPQLATNNKKNKSQDSHIKEYNDKPSSHPTDEASTAAKNTPTQFPPTLYPTATPTPQATSTPMPNTTKMIIYPGSQQTSETSESVIYSTSESAEVVGEWYKSHMESQNYNVRNYIKSTVNGETIVTIAAASSQTTLEIIIRQSPGSQTSIAIKK